MNCPGNSLVTTFLRVDKKLLLYVYLGIYLALRQITPEGRWPPRDLSGVKPTFQISKTIEFINSLNSSLDIHP